MYNLAKLLTEAPEKLERLIILFLKLLIVLFLCNSLFNYNISISKFIESPIAKDFSISKVIFFIVIIIAVWLLVWNVFAEIILGDLLSFFFSKLVGKVHFYKFLNDSLKIIKDKAGTSNIANSIIQFVDNYLNEFTNTLKEGKSRIRQYYFILTILYFTFIFFIKDIDLSNWLKWFGGILILFYLLVNVFVNLLYIYITENTDEMKKLFSRLTFCLMTVKAVEQNPFIKQNYKKSGNLKRLRLDRQNEDKRLPAMFQIFPVYYWNDTLIKAVLDKGLQDQTKTERTIKTENFYDVLISNVMPNEENVRNIVKIPHFAYLFCEDKDQIYKNFEVFLFKVTNGLYRIE